MREQLDRLRLLQRRINELWTELATAPRPLPPVTMEGIEEAIVAVEVAWMNTVIEKDKKETP